MALALQAAQLSLVTVAASRVDGGSVVELPPQASSALPSRPAMNGVASRLDCRVFTLSPERYTQTIEVAFYVVRKESAAKHRLSAQRMRRQKLVVKWFYITVFFTIPVTSGGTATARQAKSEGREKRRIYASCRQYRAGSGAASGISTAARVVRRRALPRVGVADNTVHKTSHTRFRSAPGCAGESHAASAR